MAFLYRTATESDLLPVTSLVHDTIRAIYPRYYPAGVVEFFCEHHCSDHILADIRRGIVGVLFVDDRLVGTASRQGNHITRFFVSPQDQGKGYGTYILHRLEQQIARFHDRAVLEASLPSVCRYERLGYQTQSHHTIETASGDVLVYVAMERNFTK